MNAQMTQMVLSVSLKHTIPDHLHSHSVFLPVASLVASLPDLGVKAHWISQISATFNERIAAALTFWFWAARFDFLAV